MFNINNLPFVPVVGISDLSVNTDGEFITTRNNKPRYVKKASNGYLEVRHTVEGHTKGYSAHRLVALTFIPNPLNLPIVNHKDGNKHNNAVSNLEWCDASCNVKHAYNNGVYADTKTNRPTIEIINSIRSSYIPKSRSNGTLALAKKHGLSKTAVFKIVHHLTYKGVK